MCFHGARRPLDRGLKGPCDLEHETRTCSPAWPYLVTGTVLRPRWPPQPHLGPFPAPSLLSSPGRVGLSTPTLFLFPAVSSDCFLCLDPACCPFLFSHTQPSLRCQLHLLFLRKSRPVPICLRFHCGPHDSHTQGRFSSCGFTWFYGSWTTGLPPPLQALQSLFCSSCPRGLAEGPTHEVCLVEYKLNVINNRYQ